MHGLADCHVHDPSRFGRLLLWARVHTGCQHCLSVTYCINTQPTFTDPKWKELRDKSVKFFHEKRKGLFWSEHIWLGRAVQRQVFKSTFHLVARKTLTAESYTGLSLSMDIQSSGRKQCINLSRRNLQGALNKYKDVLNKIWNKKDSVLTANTDINSWYDYLSPSIHL